MIQFTINILILLGSMLMILNIIGFIKYAVFVRGRHKLDKGRGILYVPIALLCSFFLGYVTVGIFGSPDIVMAGILFGGSIFVFIMLLLLNRITKAIIESEQLEASLKAAEESNRMKTSFLATISHEMRTPLNVILGLDELARMNPDITEDTRMSLIKIERSGKHLLGLINNILDMQNVEADKQAVKNEAFSLHNAVNQIDAIIGTMCEEKGLHYTSVTDEKVQDGLIGDEMLLKQIMMNLLDNAVKFTSAPGTVTFAVKEERSDENTCVLRFVVKDSGSGISKEFLPKVFDLFSQEDEGFTNRYGGSGMGLAVTKQKVEQMKGTISVISEEGKGSEFTVIIPFGRSEADIDPEKNAANVQDASAFLAGRRILIVEDVDENAEIVADLLELEDAVTERAENGAAALDMVKQSGSGYYDAILMDLRMPVMDGIESAKKIRELGRSDAQTIPIIALTANTSEEDIRNTTEAGMNAHLVKPIDSEMLYQTLSRLITAQN